MAKKEFMYHGMTIEDLQALSIEELSKHLDAAARRKLKRGFTEQEKIFLKNLETSSKTVKTHQRQMLVLPSMVGRTIGVYTGKEFVDVIVEPEMIGNRLGEYAMSRRRAKHTQSGVGKGKK